MKHLIILIIGIALLQACNNQSAEKKDQAELKSVTQGEAVETVAMSIEKLYENARELEGKEVVVTGTVMHVCKHGGGRCFLMGSNEDINIRVEAGEKIGSFSQELMGSDIEVVGIFKEVRTEADAHNPGKHHGEEDHDHDEDEETENAHRVIAEAQEKVEVVYFIEGLKSKEL